MNIHVVQFTELGVIAVLLLFRRRFQPDWFLICFGAVLAAGAAITLAVATSGGFHVGTDPVPTHTPPAAVAGTCAPFCYGPTG
ncbi:hypothetical protein GPX89_40740 [Nocardia sp. ET3-3]|uniref:Uncharacterized protein n=1 Tax=Nocardia terrae TaxID=2675851 RepID=A0A7K1VA72_9NOCA|nr:hypothetical protein [Nocardia terrae]MVU83553.1 hypothetical protein [Nocardia terrae]